MSDQITRDLARMLYTGLSSLSRGLETDVNGMRRLVGELWMLRNDQAQEIADVLAVVADGLNTRLNYIAQLQDIIRSLGMAPPE